LSNIGHNEGPDISSITLLMEARYDDLFNRCKQLMTSFGRVPLVIKDEETQAKVNVLVGTISTLITMMDQARTKEKQPHLEAGREVDIAFKPSLDDLKGAKEVLAKRGGEFLAKVPEAQVRSDTGSLATLVESWEAKEVDCDAVDPKELWPFMSTKAIREAAQEFCKLHPLDGEPPKAKGITFIKVKTARYRR